MDDDYYSIDSILAENQKVQCSFKVDVPDMGHLAGGNERDIKADAKVALPVWLAYIVIFSGFADFNMPQPFMPRVKNALNAEPRSVRLSHLVGAGGLWYGFGRMVTRLLDEERSIEMSNLFMTTFRERLTEIIDQAQHFAVLGQGGLGSTHDDAAAAFREGLDGTEREMFALAQLSAKWTKQWYDSTDRGRR